LARGLKADRASLEVFQTLEDSELMGGKVVSFRCQLKTNEPMLLSGWENPNLQYFDGYTGEYTSIKGGDFNIREVQVTPFPQKKIMVSAIRLGAGQKVRLSGVVLEESFLQSSYLSGPKKGQPMGGNGKKIPIDEALIPSIKEVIFPHVAASIAKATDNIPFSKDSLQMDVDWFFIYWQLDMTIPHDLSWTHAALLLPSQTVIELNGKASRGGTPYQWKDEPTHGWSLGGETTATLK
jgi:hypothetical protein